MSGWVGECDMQLFIPAPFFSIVTMIRRDPKSYSFRDFARLGVPVTLAAMAGLLAWVALMT